MAERRSGPVKPPTLDLTARAASAEKPSAGPKPSEPASATPDKASAETAPPKTAASGPAEPKRAAPLSGMTGLGLAAISGGVLGLVFAMALAVLGYWPAPTGSNKDVAALAERLDGFTSKLAAETTRNEKLEADIAATQSQISANSERAATEIAGLRDEIAGLPAPTAPADLSGIDADIAALKTALAGLSDRIDNLSLTASTDGAVAPEVLSALKARLASLDSQIAALSQTADANQTDVAAIQETIAQNNAIRARLERQVADLAARPLPTPQAPIADATRLTLALSGLDKALTSGAPFAAELAAISSALPDVTVPQALTAHAETGLPQPTALSDSFAAAIPTILAARPIDPDASWTDKLLERIKTLIALRPAEATAGDDPAAIVAGIESALRRGEFTAANALIASLPEQMRLEASAVAAPLVTLAAAEQGIADLRRAALEDGSTAQ